MLCENNYAKCTRVTLHPNGASERAAILKNCFPNGMPTIVMHIRHPSTKLSAASSSPVVRNQIISQLEALKTNRNADDGNAPHASCKYPAKCADPAAQYDPKNIA